MNPKPCLFTGVLGFVLCLLLGSARADDEADRTALRLIRTNYMDAVNSSDPSKIAPYLSKDVTGVMVTGEEVKGFEDLVAYWKKIQGLLGPGGSYRVTVNVDKTDLFGDTAVSRGTTDDLVRLGTGKELPFNSRWTAVCRKENGAWKVLRMEATMDPVNNIFVSLQLTKARLAAAGCGFLAGAAITLLFGLMKRRSPKPAG